MADPRPLSDGRGVDDDLKKRRRKGVRRYFAVHSVWNEPGLSMRSYVCEPK